jgi:hypothetical protein
VLFTGGGAVLSMGSRNITHPLSNVPSKAAVKNRIDMLANNLNGA